jgi:hypothetical protein
MHLIALLVLSSLPSGPAPASALPPGQCSPTLVRPIKVDSDRRAQGQASPRHALVSPRPALPGRPDLSSDLPPRARRRRHVIMDSSYLGKRKLDGGEREPPAAAFLPAVALGYEYEYGDAEAVDHRPCRAAAGEMDFFKKEEKRERKAAAALVPSDDLGIKEDEVTINVRNQPALPVHPPTSLSDRRFPTSFPDARARRRGSVSRWVCTTSTGGRAVARSPSSSTTAYPPTMSITGRPKLR